MSVYLDASVLVALFTSDALSARAVAFMRRDTPEPTVSDFAGAEFASAIGLKVRTGRLTAAEAQQAFANFDEWTTRAAAAAWMESSDVNNAALFLRRLDLSLRTPDALNVAMALRLGAELATLDIKMAKSASSLGASVATL